MDRLPLPPIDHPRFRARALQNDRAASDAVRPGLRLVGADQSPSWSPAATPKARAARAVSRENAAAASIPEADARRLLAARVAEMLDGGTAARLAPERRARAVRLARILGLREFDAHLVIAIAQDAARRGARPSSISLDGRLTLVGHPSTPQQPPRARGRAGLAWALALGAGLGAAGALGLIRWVAS